jgi:glucosamine--fructose-6-phosphate aminotransferase (isomerizing)
MSNDTSWMAREIATTPEIIARQPETLIFNDPLAEVRHQAPQLVVTCARGSSAHAATFAKHLIERYLGLPVSEAAPSIASVYQRQLSLRGQLVLAISQSGNSDDLIAFASHARDAGAMTVAVTNDPASPLAAACAFVLSIAAGPERSIAATKTFIATAAVLLRLVGAWAENPSLLTAASRLPDRIFQAATLDWSLAAEILSRATHLATIGRGPTLGMAREAALKLKETCNLPTEAFSGAEFLHGPIAMVRPKYPVLALIPADEAAWGMRQLCRDLDAKDATMLIADTLPTRGIMLPVLPAEQPEADALCLMQNFYVMLIALGDRLGVDIDAPPHLRKITRTT